MSKQMGFDCEEHEDGSQTCKRFVNKGKKRFATGTDFDLILDPSNCKVRMSGMINDEDRESADNKAKDMETKCRKGF